MENIKVAIADDSEIYILGIKSVLGKENDITIAFTASNCGQVKSYLDGTVSYPDVFLLDISMEEEADGLILAKWLQEKYPMIKVLILSHYKDIRFIIQALQARVRGYIAKDTATTELANAIRTVFGGKGIYLGDTIPYQTLIYVFGCDRNIMKGKPQELTEKELTVLKYLSEGISVKEMASVLKLSVNSIESHKEHIKDKMGVKSIMEAIVFAVKNNMLP